jgi:hypothetical protein
MTYKRLSGITHRIYRDMACLSLFAGVMAAYSIFFYAVKAALGTFYKKVFTYR